MTLSSSLLVNIDMYGNQYIGQFFFFHAIQINGSYPIYSFSNFDCQTSIRACVVVDDRLFVIGGQEGDFMAKPGSPIFKCSRRHEVYDPPIVL